MTIYKSFLPFNGVRKVADSKLKKINVQYTHILKILKDFIRGCKGLSTRSPYLFSIKNDPLKQHCLKELDFLIENSKK